MTVLSISTGRLIYFHLLYCWMKDDYSFSWENIILEMSKALIKIKIYKKNNRALICVSYIEN